MGGCATHLAPTNSKYLWLGFRVLVPALFLIPLLARAEAPEKGPMNLSIHDCVVMALENNLEISIQRLSPLLDDAAILQARGEFDPALTLTPNYEENSTPLDAQSSVAAGGRTATKSRTSSLATGIQGKTPFGTTYDFGLRTTDSQNTFNSFRDQYSTFWGLSLTQPLLKGFGSGNQLATLRIARKQREISNEAFAFKVMDIVTRMKSAYYNLIFAIENQRVQQQALDLAAKLLEDNRKRVRIGVMAPLEVTQAESGVAGQQEDVLIASQEVNSRMNELRSIISRDISAIRDRPLAPVDAPTEVSPPLMQVDELYKSALENRPDYRQARMIVEQRHLQLKFDQNQSYPQIDLKGTYGYNGIGKDLPASIGSENQRWSVGLAVRVPLPDQTGEGRAESSRLQKERALLQLKRVEQIVLVEVDNAFQAVQLNHKRIQATRVSVRAAREALEAEMTKLKTGTSTSFVVLELQKKLADARSREIRALTDYNISLAELYRAEGVTLRENNIELAQ